MPCNEQTHVTQAHTQETFRPKPAMTPVQEWQVHSTYPCCKHGLHAQIVKPMCGPEGQPAGQQLDQHDSHSPHVTCKSIIAGSGAPCTLVDVVGDQLRGHVMQGAPTTHPLLSCSKLDRVRQLKHVYCAKMPGLAVRLPCCPSDTAEKITETQAVQLGCSCCVVPDSATNGVLTAFVASTSTS